MSTSSFQESAEIAIDGKTYTLIRKVEANLWQAEEHRSKRVVEFSEDQLRRLYVQGKLRFNLPTTPSSRAPKPIVAVECPPERWEEAKVRRAYVIATLDIPNSRTRLIPVIEETWEKLQQPAKPPNAATVIRWKNKYQQAGNDITVLLEQSERKGNYTSRYPYELENFVQKAIDEKYLRQERGTIQDTLDYAQALVLRENNLRPSASQLPLPTRRHVKTLINATPAFDRYAARHGRTAAVKRFRSVQAHRTTAAPLERAEMDHTLLDLMVIDDSTGLPLGRPWITACIDDFTRCVLGIYVSFEPPSHFTVARCLKQAFLPKVQLQEEFPAIKNKWDAHGVMRELVVDNGTEFHSVSLENACYSLGIEIHYSARKTPWFKGKIERFMGTLNRAIAHGSPGTTFQNIFDKEEYDPSKHAVVRYSVLKEIINTWVADVYHQKVHRTIGAPPALMWARSITPEAILVPDDPARLDAILGRSETRRLTHKGIELYGLLYNSHELTGLRRKLGDKLDVEVRVDTADLGKIVVFSPDRRQLFTVHAIDSAYADGLSEWQHRICKRFAAKELEQYSTAAWLEAKARISELIECEFMHKKQKTRTKIARFKGDSQLLPTESSPMPGVGAPITAKVAIADIVPSPTTHATADEPAPAATPPTTPAKRFKPVYRERTPQFVGAEREEELRNA